MSVRPHPTKAGWWIIDFYPQGRKGRRERIAMEGTQDQAYSAERGARLESRAAAPINLFPRMSETIPEFMVWYGLDHQPAGTERTNRSIQRLLPHFGAFQYPSISEQMIEAYKARRIREVKPTTINKELAALSKLLKWAKKRGYCQKVPTVERFPEKMVRAPLPYIPPQEDIERLIEAIPWPKQGIFCCMYYGGLRKGEACTLRAEDVNIEQRTMYVRGKGGRPEMVPLLKYLVPVLERRLKEVREGYLWATPGSSRVLTDLREIIEWGCKRAGITTHITPHSLRHAFGIRAVTAGVHLRTIQLILRHSSSKVTEVYTRLATSQILADVDKF